MSSENLDNENNKSIDQEMNFNCLRCNSVFDDKNEGFVLKKFIYPKIQQKMLLYQKMK